MRSIKQVYEDLRNGLSGKNKKQLGPVGEAVSVLNQVIRHAMKNNLYSSSATFSAMHVVLDHVRVIREALQASVDLCDALESERVTPVEVKEKILQFKLFAVKARLHQYVPIENLPKLESSLSPENLKH